MKYVPFPLCSQVVTPQKCGDVYLYDLLPPPTTPPNRNQSPNSSLHLSHQHYDQDTTYDHPKPAVHISSHGDSPRGWCRTPPNAQLNRYADDSYDIPRPSTNLLQQRNITPSSSNSSLLTTTSDSLSLSISNRSSLANMPDYDIPRKSNRHFSPPLPTAATAAAQDTYDIPQKPTHQNASMINSSSSITSTTGRTKELPLELSSALETLAKLQNETTAAISRLLGFVSPNWRSLDKLEPILLDIKLAAIRLRTALHDLAEFGEGALGNAARANDKNLAAKLRPLVKALRDTDSLVHEASQCLEFQGWTAEILAKRPENGRPADSLDQLMACAQTLTEDVRQTTSFIQGNATLLFKRAVVVVAADALPTNRTSTSAAGDNGEWLEDYDYVSLESKEASARKNAELRDGLPSDLATKYEVCVQNAESAAIARSNERPSVMMMNADDKSLLVYYATQTVTHMGHLTQAIDAFLQTVERNQPPKFFLAYGKFVVLSAHSLVNIGDIVHRNVTMVDVKRRVLLCADTLSEALKICVAKTKKAAQHFPSIAAVQEMVDSVVDISHSAYELKIAMLQAVQP